MSNPDNSKRKHGILPGLILGDNMRELSNNTLEGQKLNNNFGKVWQDKYLQWFRDIKTEFFYVHEIFEEYIKIIKYKPFNGVLEIGCGEGEYREGMRLDNYLGIDISHNAIKLSKTRNGNFKQVDFLKLNTIRKFDLIFSHSVVDHTENIDKFFIKSLKKSRKYVYHTAYQSYDDTIPNHIQRYEPNYKISYNTISIKKIKQICKNLGWNCFTIKLKHPDPKRKEGTIYIMQKEPFEEEKFIQNMSYWQNFAVQVNDKNTFISGRQVIL